MKVVVAEDSATTRLLIASTLSRRGHEVTAVEDGHAALEAIARLTPPLVLLDWHMPGLDGIAVCARLREDDRLRDTFVLMVTGHDQPNALAQALDAGADDYLQKPASAEQLLARCEIAERRIRLDQLRRHAEATAARAQWLAGIGQTALAIQHEVNNPLTALLGSAALLEMGAAEEEEQRQLLVVIVEQAQRIAAVVKRLGALDDPRTVEYLAGAPMLDLGATV